MKRLNFILGAAALAAVSLTASPSVNAQENGNRDEFGDIVRGPYETNRFGDNWFIGVGGGINIFWNDGYKTAIGPSLDVNAGKWITPSIGLRAGYQGLSTRAWSYDQSVLAPDFDTDKGMYKEKFGYMYIHGDVMWNISNALSGYKETRFWNFVPYMHTGFFRAYGLDDADYADNEFAAGAGLLHNLRLSDRLDLIIDMRATVVNGRIHGAEGIAVLPSVTAGLAVDLGWPNFVRTSTIVGAIEIANAEKFEVLETAVVALEAANAALEAQNAELAQANGKLSKELKSLRQTTVNETTFFEDMGPATIYFNIGQATLNDKEKQHLDFIAKNLISKAASDTKIYLTLMGTADSNTGSASRNKQLSEARGKYVYDILTTKYGIAPDRLIVKSEVVKAASKPELSRAVVISF